MRARPVDKPFLFAIITLLVGGFFIFLSAALGLHARGDINFASVVFRQVFFGFILGGVACFLFSRIHYRFWRDYALYLFVGALILTTLVFVPGLGMEHGGAERWISLLGFSFQPAEFLKIAFVLYLGAWLSKVKDKIHQPAYGLIPILIIMAIVGGLLALQPDIGTFLVITCAMLGLYFAAGANVKDFIILILIGALAFGALALAKPYITDRIMTFLNPEQDAQGSGYQIQQSLIAIGSGQIAGRGFGQSVQKFNYLPEPIGDSVFAVAAEEFGFIGSTVILALFLFFAFRGLRIASHAPDLFGGLVCLGIVILITAQSLINIASMLGVFPLTGMPLLFISQGGTALMVTLAALGIVLNISKYQKV